MERVVVPYFKRYYEAPVCESAVPEEPIGVKMEAPSLPVRDFMLFNQKTETMDYTKRIIPDYITSLKPKQIFVFGSNLAGMHGGGAARAARLYFGAKMGVGVGPQGQSYAIPTMQSGQLLPCCLATTYERMRF